MILVNIKNSYPELLERESSFVDQGDLANITLGDWPSMRRETVMPYLDMVCGTHGGRIVTAFPANDFDYVGDDRLLRFRSSMTSDELAEWGRQWDWLIGVPMPGGVWRVGESRGTRRVDTDAYLAGEGAAYINRAAPSDVEKAMEEMAAFTLGLQAAILIPGDPAEAPSPVDVTTSASGEVRITVRAGTPFTLTVK